MVLQKKIQLAVAPQQLRTTQLYTWQKKKKYQTNKRNFSISVRFLFYISFIQRYVAGGGRVRLILFCNAYAVRKRPGASVPGHSRPPRSLILRF